MADVEVEREESTPSGPRYPTQAAWDKKRAADKRKAAKVVKANAVEAAEAKAKALGKAPNPGTKDFLAKAKEVQDRIDAKAKATAEKDGDS